MPWSPPRKMIMLAPKPAQTLIMTMAIIAHCDS
jgi:hypothetical protein